MGRPKQLLALDDGRTLLRRAADAARDAGAWPVVVVVGARMEADAGRVAAALDGSGAVVAANGRWAEGPGTSVACGVAAVERIAPGVAAVVVALADQPLVSADDLRRLADAALASPSGASAAAYDGTAGAPACFDRRHLAALRSLDPSAGAKRLLASIAGVARVPMPGAAVDLDTPEQAARFAAGDG